MTIFSKVNAGSGRKNQKELVIEKIHRLLETVEKTDSVEEMRCLAKETRELTSLFFHWKSPTRKNWYSVLTTLPK